MATANKSQEQALSVVPRGLLLLLVLVALWVLQLPVLAEKRTALVIGNSAYEKALLVNPVNDAKDLAEALRGLGFDVMHKENVDRRGIKEAVRAFGRELAQTGGVGLFYYAGHGVQVGGRNYLIPLKADINSEADVEYEAVDLGFVMEHMEGITKGVRVAILDACRDNPFGRSFRTTSRGLARVDAPTGTLLAYATAPGSVAADGRGRNSPYTKHLLREMMKPEVEVEDVLKQVRIRVMDETQGKQVPWESSSLVGSFYFKEVLAPQVTELGPRTADDAAMELAFWESIKDSKHREVYEAYLAKYPNGQFASIAKLRLNRLQTQRPIPKTPLSVENHRVEVTSLLQECDRHYRANRLLTGRGGTAVGCYRKVLTMEPGNPEALAGLEKVARTYASWTGRAIREGNRRKAYSNLAKLQQVNPEDPQIEPLRQQLAHVTGRFHPQGGSKPRSDAIREIQDEYRLTILVTPSDAHVEILDARNNSLGYTSGMPLEPGNYYIWVTKSGYHNHEGWVRITNRNVVKNIVLRVDKAAEQQRRMEQDMFREIIRNVPKLFQ